MAFLKGLFGSKGGGLAPEERGAVEGYLTAADPLVRQLDAEYHQWLERAGVDSPRDVTGINDPKGEHSGLFVWRSIEAERTFTQLQPTPRAAKLHDSYLRCVEQRHQAASAIYEALQVADVRSPRAILQEASRVLTEAESLRRQAEQQREALERQIQ